MLRKRRNIPIYLLFALVFALVIVLTLMHGKLKQLEQKKNRDLLLQDKKWQQVLQDENEREFDPALNEISATVLKVNKEEKQVELHVIWPPSAPLHNKIIVSDFRCTASDTSTIENGEKVLINKDPMDVLKPKQNIRAFCSNASCAEIRGLCVLR